MSDTVMDNIAAGELWEHNASGLRLRVEAVHRDHLLCSYPDDPPGTRKGPPRRYKRDSWHRLHHRIA